MAKYSKKKVKLICDLIIKDTFTIAEICANAGISERCFYDWQANNAEFAEIITHARDNAKSIRVREAKKSLMKKIQGYDVDENKTVYVNDTEGKPKIKERTTIKKHIQPDTNAIIFVLTNDDPENFKNRQNTELTGKDGKDLFHKVTDEDLDKRISELEKKLKK